MDHASPFGVATGDAPRSLGLRVRRLLEKAMGLGALSDLYSRLPRECADDFPAEVLAALDVRAEVSEDDRERIPRQGPLIVVANHPFGAVDGLLLMQILGSLRPDVRFLVNRVLGRLPELRPKGIFVELFSEDRRGENASALREAVRHVRAGGCLALFPAGVVSHWQTRRRRVVEAPWNRFVTTLVQTSDAPVLPVHFEGRNSLLFQAAGLIHPAARTALLARETLNKRGRTIPTRIGHPIPANEVLCSADPTEVAATLRRRTLLLAHRNARRTTNPGETPSPTQAGDTRPEVIAEMAGLPVDQVLARSGGFRVIIASNQQIPETVREIGRLREITYREVGEGTGEEIDLDRFDEYYLHLVLWHEDRQEVAGAYRLGLGDQIQQRHGREGLYTSTLFEIDYRFLANLGPAIELGRSFVRREYQRSFTPLMLLWKGIGAFVARNPRYRMLIGPVSISARYSEVSQRLMMAWIERHAMAHEWRHLCRPLHPVSSELSLHAETSGLDETLTSLDGLSRVIADLEISHRGVPVLLREYHRLGGRFVAFSRDPDFGDVIDGLVVVDLVQAPRRTLHRYLGTEGTRRLLAFHAPPLPVPTTLDEDACTAPSTSS